MLPYLKFLLKSTNHHGIHSPFVFNYLTKCLYKKPRLSRNRTENLLLKSISYFHHEQVKILGDEALERRVKTLYPSLKLDTELLDVLFVSNSVFKNSGNVLLDYSFHNDSMLILDGIRESKVNFDFWENVINSKKVIVSIDFYGVGVVFFRKEQEKEHFTIRL